MLDSIFEPDPCRQTCLLLWQLGLELLAQEGDHLCLPLLTQLEVIALACIAFFAILRLHML